MQQLATMCPHNSFSIMYVCVVTHYSITHATFPDTVYPVNKKYGGETLTRNDAYITYRRVSYCSILHHVHMLIIPTVHCK